MESTENEPVLARQECTTNIRNISDALYVLNGKWKLPLIYTIRQHPLRFNEIMKLLEGITPKVLAKELKELENNGFIQRHVYPTIPVTVLYEATAYSESLNNILYELGRWGEQHREKIKQSMRDYKVEGAELL